MLRRQGCGVGRLLFAVSLFAVSLRGGVWAACATRWVVNRCLRGFDLRGRGWDVRVAMPGLRGLGVRLGGWGWLLRDVAVRLCATVWVVVVRGFVGRRVRRLGGAANVGMAGLRRLRVGGVWLLRGVAVRFWAALGLGLFAGLLRGWLRCFDALVGRAVGLRGECWGGKVAAVSRGRFGWEWTPRGLGAASGCCSLVGCARA